MLTYIVSFAVGFLVFACVRFGFDTAVSWSVFWGVLALFAVQIGISLFMRKLLNKMNGNIQQIMLDVQKRIQTKQDHFMRRPTDPKLMMRQLEHEQAVGIERALEECKKFQPLYKWNPFLKKQINTMRMAFLFQLKKYDEVDAMLPDCIFFDPQSIAIKMVRMYKKNDPELGRFYKKKIKRLRKDSCVLPVSLYAWILVKQGKADDAFKVLGDALKKTSDETIQSNWQALANKKLKQFSNAGLGESWYALGLEEPKMVKMRPQYKYR